MNRTFKLLLATQGCLGMLTGAGAQEVITGLAGNPAAALYYRNHPVYLKAAAADTLELPFFEDFSDSYVVPDPSRWIDRSAFVNNNYCVDPVSNGVATLDAVDFDGSFYPDATIEPRTYIADHLTSRPINLSYVPGDSLYLSFFIQPGGLGNVPQEQDSLLMDFYSPEDSAWTNVWASPGYASGPFRQIMVPITDTRYLVKGFRFRFRNRASLHKNDDYADKRSNQDLWNLDYIRLGINRSAGDTLLRDVAFVSPLNSVLKDLTSLPWSHFAEARLTALDPRIPAKYRNNDQEAHNVTRSLRIEEPIWNETFTPGEPTAQDLPGGQDTVVEFDYFYPIDFTRGDSAIVRFIASLRTDELDPKVNDTVVYDQVFKDYYAYDDGTPEAGYGLRAQGTSNGSVAVRYHAFTGDLLGGVDISFNQVYDSLNLSYYFRLIVWEDNEGIPGTILHEDGNDLVPVYSKSFPGFVRYHFTKPVQVDGDFYVGWRQYNKYMLNVGLDLNNRPSSVVMFYNYQGIWEASGAPGVILLRPFLYREPTPVPMNGPGISFIKVSPNPTTGPVRILLPSPEINGPLSLEIFDASGRKVKNEILETDAFDVSELSSGLYLLFIRCDGMSYHSKLLISH